MIEFARTVVDIPAAALAYHAAALTLYVDVEPRVLGKMAALTVHTDDLRVGVEAMRDAARITIAFEERSAWNARVVEATLTALERTRP